MHRQKALQAAIAVAALVIATSAGAAPSTVHAVVPDADMIARQIPTSKEPRLSRDREIALLRRNVKYVFVLYQENRSFDSYFGTFPGAEGLFSHPAAQTPGFNQSIVNVDGTAGTVQPFRVGPDQYASDTDDIDHSHPAIVYKIDVVNGAPRMDRFAEWEEKKYSKGAPIPTLMAKQFGELSMAYEDGDTIPILWRYANRFVLCDHIFQLMTGPSTPGNLSIIGAQTGVTQWIKHPEQAYQGNGSAGPGLPMLDDAAPLWGSAGHEIPGIPDSGATSTQFNLTFATLPLTLAGSDITGKVRADADPKGDLGDVDDDIPAIAKESFKSVPWGWFQEGFDKEPTDDDDKTQSGPVDAEGRHASYITHHNGPQYFGYIANNPQMRSSMHGLQDFYDALKRRALPAEGVFYVKGGRKNILGLHPADPSPRVQADFLGDDDHPAYSDSQISEAAIADAVNAIAASPYWAHCAIVITWDDSEGDYDHVEPPLRAVGPDGSPISDGPRVPLLLISPYARVHAVDSDEGDHASVVKLVDLLFGLTPLADLPDEKAARDAAAKKGLANAGPFDDLTAGVTDLLGAFDPARLSGSAPILPPSYAEVPADWLTQLPSQLGLGWRRIGVAPADFALGIPNHIPDDFNPRPKSEPTPSK